MKRAIFLDRDGTLIEEQGYLNDPNKVFLIDRVVPALRQLQNNGYYIIIITNQSGIGRGLISIEEYQAVHQKLCDLLQENDIQITADYFCPHHPSEAKKEFLQECDCRKPEPGLILKAIEEHSLDPERSFMIGDKISDIQAGQNANLKTILVRTGYGTKTSKNLQDLHPDFIAEDLYDAVVNYILE